jgi:hypothetical protein
MEYAYTICIGSDRMGDVYKVSDAFIVYKDVEHKDANRRDSFFETKVERDTYGEVVEVIADDPLRELSSQPYIINTECDMIYNDIMYEVVDEIPAQCRYIAMPVIDSSQVMDYVIRHPNDIKFIEEGYVKELRDAKHVIIAPSSYHNLGDLLIEKVEGDVYTSFNGRCTQLKSSDISTVYVEMKTEPIFSGSYRELPYTYTPQSLINKYKYLNMRLQKYGAERVRSMLASLQSVSNRVAKDSNQFAASQIYDKVVSVVSDLR